MGAGDLLNSESARVSLKKNVIANYFGAGWTALMTLAFVPLYIRYLGIEAYGLIGIYTILQAWLSILDLGMTPSLSREMAGLGIDASRVQRARDLLRSAEVVAAGIALIVASSIWLGSGWLAHHWLSSKAVSGPVVAQAFAIMGLVIGLRFVENIYRSSVVGLQRQVLLNVVVSIVATLRGLGVLAVLAFVSPTIQAYFLWQGIVSMGSIAALAAVTYHVMPSAPRPSRFSPAALREVWRFAAGTILITLLSLVLSQADKILLSRLLSLAAFGFYAFAVAVAQMPLAVVGPITQAFFPRFTALLKQDDHTSLADAYHAASQLTTVLLGSATVLLALFGHEILMAWTRNAELSDQTYYLVAVISLGSLFNGLMTIPYFLQLSSGWTGLTIRINLVAAVLVVPALLWIVPKYGAIGAAWVWVSLNACYLVVVIPLMHRRLLINEKWRWYLGDVGFPLAVAAVTGLLLRTILPDASGVPSEIVKLGVCIMLVPLTAILAAPIVRAQFLSHLPSIGLKR